MSRNELNELADQFIIDIAEHVSNGDIDEVRRVVSDYYYTGAWHFIKSEYQDIYQDIIQFLNN